MANKLKIKRSAVSGRVPLSTDLELGELALNTFDGKLYTKKDNGTVSVIEIGAGGGVAGTVTSVAASGGSTGLTFTGSPITTSGTLTLGGTLAVANGGTGATTAAGALTNLGAYPATNPSGYTSNTGTVTGVTGTAPIVSSGGTAPAISISAATTSAAGSMSSADKTKLDGIAASANNYVLPKATATALGGVEVFDATVQTVAANAVTTTASRTYGVQLNAVDQMVVNVPWVDTNSGGTVTSVAGTGTVSGLTLSGTVTSSGSLTLGGTLSLTSGNVTTALGYTPYNATNPSGYITGSGSITGSAGSLTGFTNSNSANPISGPDNLTNNGLAYVTSISLLGQIDGALYAQAYSSSWVHQIYGDYRTGQIALRGKNNGAWQAWRIALDSGNYTSYSPSLTGSGASGSWGISVTGNAANVTGTVAIANGGTGSTTAAAALTALGAYPATNPNGYTNNTGTVTGVTGTAPIVSSGGTAPAISISAATTSAAGSMSSADKTKLDGIAANANNYVLPKATATALGGVEVFDATVQTVAANAVTTTASRTYGVQLNAVDQMVVNVPWTDANSGGTVTSVSGTGTVSGLTLTGSVTTSGSLTLGGTLSLTSGNVTTALGYTPYNATNPSGYTSNVGTVTSVATGTGLTGGPITSSGTIALANTAVTAGSYTNASITVDAQGRLTAASSGSDQSTGKSIVLSMVFGL